MALTISIKTIDYIFTVLQEEASDARPATAEKLFLKYASSGWIPTNEVEDLLDLLDSRISFLEIDLFTIYEQWNIPIEEVFRRPRKISTFTRPYRAIRMEYFVSLLILLERMGFEVYAAKFVKLLLPKISNRANVVLSTAELDIFWYDRDRFKMADIELESSEDISFGHPQQTYKSPTGFTYSLSETKRGEIQKFLKIRAPKYRVRQQPIRTKCLECGHEWEKGDPESSLLHRREHKKVMTWLKPAPLIKMINALAEDGLKAEFVDYTSSSWKHQEMYNRATAFKREMGYDFIQWSLNGDDPDAHGYLFTEQNAAIIGACSFRQRFEKGNARWELDWIWFAPLERRKGHLTRRWKNLRDRYGNFLVTFPVSDAMESFLKKIDEMHLLK